MKIMFLTVLLLMFSSFALGADYSKYDNAIYRLTSIEGESEIKNRIAELDAAIADVTMELKLTPEDAQLNYIKGRAIYAYIYTIPRPRTNQQVIEIKALKKEAYKWYQNAIKYDRNDLTVKQLYIMNGFNPELVVATIDKIIERDNRLIGEDKQVVELKRQKIVALIRLGRFEEAEIEVKALRANYPDRFKETSVAYYKKEIYLAKEKLKAAKEKEEKTLVSKKPEEKPAEGEPVPDASAGKKIKHAASNTQGQVVAPDTLINKNSLFILVLIAVFSLYFYSRRKGKKLNTK